MVTNNSSNYTPIQHDVLIGGANGALNNISPLSAGFVLTSNGTGTDPSFQIPAVSGNLLYYFTNTASDVASELQQTAATFSPLTTRTFTGIGAGNTLLETFITNAGVPNLSFLPAGIYIVHVHADQTLGTRVVELYAEIWEATSLGVDIAKIGTTGLTDELTGSPAELQADFSDSNTYTFTSTASRIKTKIFASGGATGSNATVNIFVGDTADSHTSLPGPTADVTNFVPYTGAVSDVNPGTHSITANSATLTNPLAIADGGTDATSFTQSNGIVTYNGTRLVNYAGPQIDTSGRMTNTTQPAFSVFVSPNVSNVTGDGTVYQYVFNNALFDNDSNFNLSTGTFTAPITGRYLFSMALTANNIAVTHTTGTWKISAGGNTIDLCTINPGVIKDGTSTFVTSASLILPMNASDTAVITMTISGSTKTIGTGSGGTGPVFSGCLLD